MAIHKIKLKIPATTANLGPGFDTLGIALGLYNEIEVTKKASSKKSFRISVEGEGENVLPLGRSNIVVVAMEKVFNIFGVKKGDFHIRLVNRIPLSRGLGSSAAARIGGLVSANMLCSGRLKENDLIDMATRLEGHPDNVVPALVGGLCVSCLADNSVKYVKLPPPESLRFIVCIPDFEVSTDKAREILPAKVAFKDAVFNVQRASLLLASLISKRYRLLSVATQDRLHQVYRSKLIPGAGEIFRIASGSGRSEVLSAVQARASA